MRNAGVVGGHGVSMPAAGVVDAAWVAVRAEPGHGSELVSQWLCGETLTILDQEEAWSRTRGPDGYEGWCSGGGLLLCDEGIARRWREAASARSLGSRLEGPGTDLEGGGSAGRQTTWLPFGARVAGEAEGIVRLPLQVRVSDPEDGTIVAGRDRPERFPRRGDAVIRTASAWSGAPYLWGGRTPHGTDCSGFIQAVYGMHGVGLPRDSGRQMEATPAVEGAVREPGRRRVGDLLFFRSEKAEAVSHVALSLGGTRVVHAADVRGGFARDDLADPPPELEALAERLIAVTRPLATAEPRTPDVEGVDG